MLNVPEEVKELLKKKNIRKNFRIHFPNGERDDICIKNLIEESVKFNESICSKDALKFGLCESSALEFETVGVENIKGKTIEAQIEIDVSKILDEKTDKFTYEVNGNNSIVLDFGNEYIEAVEGGRFYIEFDKTYKTNLEWIKIYKDGTTSSTSTKYVRAIDAPIGNKDILKFQINFDADENSSELPNTISVSSDYFVIDDSNYQRKADVPFPFYPITYGKFIVNECKKQSDVNRRRVVAYSDYINAVDVLNAVEKMKMNCPVKSASDHKYNPVLYALSNASAQVNFDTTDFTDFGSGTSLTDKLVSGTANNFAFSNYGSATEVGFFITSYFSKLNLIPYKDSSILIAYSTGKRIHTKEYVLDEFNKLVDKYATRIANDKLDFALEQIAGICNPYVAYAMYTKSQNAYIQDCHEYGMSDTGLFSTEFTGYDGSQYEFIMPYKIEIQFRTHYGTETLETLSIDLFNAYEFDVASVWNGHVKGRFAYIPSISATASRIQTASGEYVVDQTQLPNSTDVLKAFLELNGSFLKVSREDGLHKIFNLNAIANDVFPSEDLYPSEILFPGGDDIYITPSDYMSEWHEDEYTQTYTEVKATYTNKDGEEATESAYEKRYNETTTLILSVDCSDDVEYIFDLNTTNPFEDGMTLLFDVGGLTIASAWITLAPDVPILDMDVEEYDTSFEYTYDWTLAKEIHIVVMSGQTTDNIKANISEVDLSEVTYERNVYDASNNYIIKNYQLDRTEVVNMLDAMFRAVSTISYMPCDILARGLPYAEAGDILRVSTEDGSIKTIILRRTLKGILSLEDNFESN